MRSFLEGEQELVTLKRGSALYFLATDTYSQHGK